MLLLALLTGCGGDPAAPGWTLPPGVESWSPEIHEAVTGAIGALPEGYEPRTRHRNPDGSATYTNRLLLESSPYLRQHAHNPVDWQPWSEAAFEQARQQDKPVLLSVGYSTCHWCHVMEEESFEDLEIATFINEHFVAIKVDREERPDVDAVYMRAVQALSGRGGWPMTVVLDADQRPFFAGTYFPPRAGVRGARIGLLEILQDLQKRWTDDRENWETHSADVAQRMNALALPPTPTEIPGDDAFERASGRMAASYDARNGGFGKAPKFPRPTELSFLFFEHHRTQQEGPRDMALGTLEAIASGGVRDHVGGGFHRYSVDAQWAVPHFEKMLYDQAQLIDAYLDAYQVTGDPRYAVIVRDTVDYVLREMRDPMHGFRSATDADSLNPDGEREEGWFFTWTPTELKAATGERGDLAVAWYGATEEGNLEGRTVLATRSDRAAIAQRFELDEVTLDTELSEIRKALYQTRKKRPAPLQDDKVILAWNAMMISALARASFVLDEPMYAEPARKAARFAHRNMVDEEGRFHRSWRAGQPGPTAVLEDYALHTVALIDLFEATGEDDWLFLATQMAAQMQKRFGDEENGGWWETAHDAEKLLSRGKPRSDGALPSGNSAALWAFVRLHELTSDDQFRAISDKGFALFGKHLQVTGGSMPLMLKALGFRASEPRQIVLVPGEDDAAMRNVLRTTYQPNKVQLLPADRLKQARLDLAKGKELIDGKTTAYVCYRGLCEAPTNEPETFRTQLTQPSPTRRTE